MRRKEGQSAGDEEKEKEREMKVRTERART